MFRRVVSRLRPLLISQRIGSFSSSPPTFPSLSDLVSPLHPIPSSSSSSNPHRVSPLFSRSFASSNSANIVTVGSAEGFKELHQKVQDEKLPSIFYFTATWCGPCRAISPYIEQLSHQYPNVTIYKVDIDQEGLGSVLNDLQISSVPTFHFLKNGQKAGEVVGADVRQLQSTMEDLYQE